LKYLSFSIFILLHFTLYAQSENIRFDHLSLEQGLSQNSVLCMLQDSRGFLWFGTEDGLNKFDGYTFTVFRHQAADSNSLSDNYITALCQDTQGGLWIGTKNGGLNKYDLKTGTFSHWKHDADDGLSVSSNHILSIFIDDSGNVWCGTYGGGISKFDLREERFVNYKHSPGNSSSLSNDFIYDIYQDYRGNIWAASYRGLSCLKAKHKSSGIFKSFYHVGSNPNSISHNRIWTFYESCFNGDTLLWIGTQNGLNCYQPQNDTFLHFYPSPDNLSGLGNSVNSIVRQGRYLWVGTYNGLYRLDLNKIPNRSAEKNGLFTGYFQNIYNKHSLTENLISSLFLDRAGTLWIGTYGGGINKYAPGKHKFNLWVREVNNPKSLSNNSIRAICEARDGLLWVGTNKGLNLLDVTTGASRHYFHHANDVNSIAGNYISALCKGQKGELWIGTYGRGLTKMILGEGNNPAFQHWNAHSKQLLHNYIQTLYQDSSGMLWIGSWGGGLFGLNPQSGNIHHWAHNPENMDSLSHGDVWCIYEDRNGYLWIGTNGGGLNFFDRRNNRFYRFLSSSNPADGLSHNTVYSIYQSGKRPAHTLWIGTADGLTKMEYRLSGTKLRPVPLAVHFKQYRVADGLPNNVIYGILEDHNGRLWLSTNKGLSCFNPQNETFTNYDSHDGLQSNEFNAGAYFKSRSGMMFFGGVQGLNGFYADSLYKNPCLPPVVITDFQLFNKPVQIGPSSPLQVPITQTGQITLNYRQNIFSFEFAALDYTAPQKNRYAYKMEGFEDNWNYVKRRFASYTGLPGGTYTFRVIASNNDGLWNTEGAAVKIIILPPPWKTWWAYIIYAVLCISAVAAWRKHDLKKQRQKEHARLLRQREKAELREAKLRAQSAEFQAKIQQAEQEKEKQHMRDRIARDLHDEIGSNLSSIKLISEFMRSRNGLDDETRRYFADIYEAAKSSADAVREIVWFVNPESDRLERLISKMKETAGAMLPNMEVDFQNPQPALQTEINPEIRRGVYLIFKELLNNIIKHSGASRVVIKIHHDKENFRLSVEDNGAGFDATGMYSGQGLKNMKYRTAQMNGHFFIETNANKGVTVTVTVKIT